MCFNARNVHYGLSCFKTHFIKKIKFKGLLVNFFYFYKTFGKAPKKPLKLST